jgi:hypothetical protein
LSFRKEKKIRVSISDFNKLQDQLHTLGMKELFEPRIINSVYFDTSDLNMFKDSEEGVIPRKKIRIRWYDSREIFTLETKISSIEGRYKIGSILNNNIVESEILTRNCTDKQYGNIQAALKVSYIRSYFMLKKMRITFDKDIIYQNLRLLNKRKYFDPERVIEIKVPADCSDDYIEQFIPYSTSRFSKYSRGILLLNDIL